MRRFAFAVVGLALLTVGLAEGQEGARDRYKIGEQVSMDGKRVRITKVEDGVITVMTQPPSIPKGVVIPKGGFAVPPPLVLKLDKVFMDCKAGQNATLEGWWEVTGKEGAIFTMRPVLKGLTVGELKLQVR